MDKLPKHFNIKADTNIIKMASLSQEEKRRIRRGEITFSEAHDIFKTKKLEEFKDMVSGEKFMKELFETLTPTVTTPFESSKRRYYKGLDRKYFKKKAKRMKRRKLPKPPKPPFRYH